MDEDRAAAKIAAAKRGKNARKQAAERKEQSKASSTIAAARKGKNARRERKEMIDGAVRIQIKLITGAHRHSRDQVSLRQKQVDIGKSAATAVKIT